jgi:RNA polymerase-associated protein
MAFLGSRRSLMTLYTNKVCMYCHRARIVLAEKGVVADLVEVDLDHPQEDLYELNPYASVPMLVDRDLVLYETNVILEYLEERFPHPPLMPVYPVARARSRLMMHRVDRDWNALAKTILKGATAEDREKARRDFYDSLLSIAPVFAENQFFLSEELSLVDCSLAALLWRLPLLGVDLPKPVAQPILNYMDRLFKRPAFQESLSDAEREMRPGYYS